MNEANEFYEELRSKHQAVLNWRDGSESGEKPNGANSSSTSQSGNENVKDKSTSQQTKTGTPSPGQKNLDLTPNG